MDDRQPIYESNDEMEPSPENSDQALLINPKESGETSPTLDSPLSVDAPENQQLPSDIIADTSSHFEPTAASSMPLLVSSVDALSVPRIDSTESPTYVLDRSEVSGANTVRSSQSPMEDRDNIDSASPPQSFSDGSPDRSKAGSGQEMSNSSSDITIVYDASIHASKKRKRSGTPLEDGGRADSTSPPQSSPVESSDRSEVGSNPETSSPSSGEQSVDDGSMPALTKRKISETSTEESDRTDSSSPPQSSPVESSDRPEVGSNPETSSPSSGEQSADDGSMPAATKRKRSETPIEESDRTDSTSPTQSSSVESSDRSEVGSNQETSGPSSGEQSVDSGSMPASIKRKRSETPIEESDRAGSASPPQYAPVGLPAISELGHRQERLGPSSEDASKPASTKRRRSDMPECDYGKSRTASESTASTIQSLVPEETVNEPPINRKARKTRTGATRIKALESSESLPSISHKKRKLRESNFGDSNDGFNSEMPSPASDDDDDQSQLNLQAETVESDVEEYELVSEWEASTPSRYSLSGPNSKNSSSNPDDLKANVSYTLPTEECELVTHSSISPNPSSGVLNKDSIKQNIRFPDADSSSVLPYSPERVVKSRKASCISNDELNSPKLPALSSFGTDSVAKHSYPDDLHRTESCINLLPKEIRDEKDELNKYPSDSKIHKSNVKSISELKKSPEPRSRHPEAGIPMQENPGGQFLQREHSEPSSGGDLHSRQQPKVGLRTNPSNTDSHVEQTPSICDIFDPSGIIRSNVTRDKVDEWNLSLASSFSDTNIAGCIVINVIKEIMLHEQKGSLFQQFYYLYELVVDYSCPENVMYLQSKILLCLSKMKEMTYNEKSYECFDNYAYDVLLRTAFLVFYYTISVRSCMDLGAMMTNYETFKTLYEKCSRHFNKRKKDDSQDAESKKRMHLIQNLLLEMRCAFEMLLMHIGNYADQVSIDKYIGQLSEGDEKFLRTSIE